MAAATYLSNKGVPFGKAHEIVGNAVRLGLESGRELERSKSWRSCAELSDAFADDFFAAITLEATLGLPRCLRRYCSIPELQKLWLP